MSPRDPAHAAACLRSLDCWTGGTVVATVAPVAPRSGGLAIRIQRGGAVLWLQARRGSDGQRYTVRDAQGRDVGPVPHQRGGSRLHEACVFIEENLEFLSDQVLA